MYRLLHQQKAPKDHSGEFEAEIDMTRGCFSLSQLIAWPVRSHLEQNM